MKRVLDEDDEADDKLLIDAAARIERRKKLRESIKKSEEKDAGKTKVTAVTDLDKIITNEFDKRSYSSIQTCVQKRKGP